MPLTAVLLSDKWPANFHRVRYVWLFVPGEPGGPHDLPMILRPAGVGDVAWFDSTEQAARTASAWCVAHGRAAAGLPELAT
jgi:hypothetical protein